MEPLPEHSSPLPEHSSTVVSPRPRPPTSSTTHLTARDLSSAPRRNAEDALRLVPGLTIVQHGSEGKGVQFFLRGFDAMHGEDFELTIEGIPINEWSNVHAQGYVDLGFIIPEVIESVEVVKGPFTLHQGAFAMAGSADYRLGIEEEDRGLRGSYTMGSTNRHRGLVTYSPKEGGGRDFAALEALHDDGYGENRDIDRGAAMARVDLLDSGRLGRFTFFGAGNVSRFSLPGALRESDVKEGRVGFYDAYDPLSRGSSSRGIGSLAYEWRDPTHALHANLFGGYRRLELQENFTNFLVDPIHGDRRYQRQDTTSFGASLVYRGRLQRWLWLNVGMGARGDHLQQAQERVGRREEPVESERALQGLQTLTHAWAGMQWRPFDSFRLTAGLRGDVANLSVQDELEGGKRSHGTLMALSPRLATEWEARRWLRLFAAYGRGFRPPEARAFTNFVPRRGLLEEKHEGGPNLTVSDSVELGLKWSPSPVLGASLAGFITHIERESVFDHVSGLNFDLKSTRRSGVEVEAHTRPFDWLLLRADLTFVDARFVGSGRRIPLAPWLGGGFRAIVTHGSGFRTGLRLLGLAGRPLPHGASGAPMVLVDATAGYHWEHFRVELEIENLFDLPIREGEYHYASQTRPGEGLSEIPALHYVAGPPIGGRLTLTSVF